MLTTEDRLSRLEKSNRSLRVSVCGLGAMFGLTLVLSCNRAPEPSKVVVAQQPTPSQAERKPEYADSIIRAKGFEIVDKNGSSRGLFSVGDGGFPTLIVENVHANMLSIRNRDAQSRIILAVDETDDKDAAKLLMLSGKDDTRVSLSATNEGSGLHLSCGGAEFSRSILLMAGKTANPSILVMGDNRTVIFETPHSGWRP